MTHPRKVLLLAEVTGELAEVKEDKLVEMMQAKWTASSVAMWVEDMEREAL